MGMDIAGGTDTRSRGRVFIDLLEQHPGLAEPIVALTTSEPGSLVDKLRDFPTETEMDAYLRAIIRTAQQARKALRGEAPGGSTNVR